MLCSQVETVRVTCHDEHTEAIGLVTIKSVIQKLRYNIAQVKDKQSGRLYTMLEARNKGILDLRNNQYIDSRTKTVMTLDRAIELELMKINFDCDDNEPEIVTKSFAINFVVDQQQKKKIPFYEAVQMGLFNTETGDYVNNTTGEKVFVGDAIRRGFLKGREVEDTKGLEIDAENKNVTEKIRSIRRSVVRSIAVLGALRRASQFPVKQ